jgi:hypothetical protein
MERRNALLSIFGLFGLGAVRESSRPKTVEVTEFALEQMAHARPAQYLQENYGLSRKEVFESRFNSTQEAFEVGFDGGVAVIKFIPNAEKARDLTTLLNSLYWQGLREGVDQVNTVWLKRLNEECMCSVHCLIHNPVLNEHGVNYKNFAWHPKF